MSKRFIEMTEELENQIVELAHTIKRIGISNVDFEYFDRSEYEVNKVYITEYNEFWEAVIVREGYANISKCQKDIYKMKFDENRLTYEFSEED